MKIQLSKHVQAPIERTFDVFSDITQTQDRIEGIVKVEILSDVQSGVGTRWRETRVFLGREATEEMEISAMTPHHSYEVVADSHSVHYHTQFTFTERNGGTDVQMTFAAHPTGLIARLMIPLGYLFKGVTVKALEADMDTLKKVCEQVHAPA